MGDDQFAEAADRRRELLKKVCPQESAVSYFAKSWSASTAVRKLHVAKLNALFLFV
jgi:hypothetical protein